MAAAAPSTVLPAPHYRLEEQEQIKFSSVHDNQEGGAIRNLEARIGFAPPVGTAAISNNDDMCMSRCPDPYGLSLRARRRPQRLTAVTENERFNNLGHADQPGSYRITYS